jgi:hypothetical protein
LPTRNVPDEEPLPLPLASPLGAPDDELLASSPVGLEARFELQAPAAATRTIALRAPTLTTTLRARIARFF